MKPLRIFKYGESVLRQKTIPVAVVTDELRALADAMLKLMHSNKGVGIAAQQVGHTESVCVIDIPDGCENDEDVFFNAPIKMPIKLFNPQIISQQGSCREKEGCLSFPGIGGSVTRAQQVTCQYTDENNAPQIITARGLLARAIQHEIDHLNGILYIDHLSAVERLAFSGKLKKLAKGNGGVR